MTGKNVFIKALAFCFLVFGTTFSFNTFAACAPCAGPPQDMSDKVIACSAEGVEASADAAAGANACNVDQKIGELTGSALDGSPSGGSYGTATMSEHIETTGNNLVDNMENGNAAILRAYQEMNVNLVATIAQMSKNIQKSYRNFEKNNLEAQMDYQSELIASTQKELKDSTGTGTSEEIKFILNELDKAETKQTRVVIAELKAKYDNVDDFRIPVKYQKYKSLTNSNGCPEYDPENNGELSDYSCYKAQKADPGKTLETYFRECSAQKRRNRGQLEEQASEKVQSQKLQEPRNIINKMTSGNFAIETHQKNSRLINCSAERLADNECPLAGDAEGEVDEENAEQYREKLVEQIIDNKIIFDGDISANNFLEPSVIGSIDGDMETTEQQERALLKKAGKIENAAVSTNTPELIKTYKTSSQYFAANDYATNIIGKGIIGNISMGERKNQSSYNFMGRNLQREAMLNMAKLSFSTAISKRTGTNITDKIHNDEVKRGGEVVQEDINGAAALDIMRKEVEDNYENITEKNIDEDFVESDEDALKKTYETEIIKARQNMEEYLNWSRIEMLLASKLVEQTSSPENIKRLRQMKSE